MGKATNPANSDERRRDRATPEQKKKAGSDRHNGKDINHASSLVGLWKSRKMLSDSHVLAIDHCWHIWGLIGQEQRTTANYGECIHGSSDGESGWLIMRRSEAKDDLNRIQSYVPHQYWQVFENCVRFDEPTGELGSKLHGGTKPSRARALTITCFVADVICMKERLTSVSRDVR